MKYCLTVIKTHQLKISDNDETKICNNIGFSNRAKKSSYFLKNKNKFYE